MRNIYLYPSQQFVLIRNYYNLLKSVGMNTEDNRGDEGRKKSSTHQMAQDGHPLLY